MSFSQLNGDNRQRPNKLAKLLSDNKNLTGFSALKKAVAPPMFNNTGQIRNLA